MKKQFFSIGLILIIANAFAQDRDVQELAKLNRDWLHSYVTKDSTMLAAILAEDFILISPNGSKWTKQAMINNLEKQELISINIDSVNTRLLTENTAILTAYTSFVMKIDGKNVDAKNCYQDVYLKRKNRWQAVSAHVTLLNQN